MSEWDISREEEGRRWGDRSGHIPFPEVDRREDAVHAALSRQRLVGPPGPHRVFRTELGHSLGFYLGDRDRRWQVNVSHPGDPTEEVISSDLGEEDGRVPDRFRHFMTHPNVVGRLAAQWKRALANGDPSGDEPDRRVVDHGGAPGMADRPALRGALMGDDGSSLIRHFAASDKDARRERAAASLRAAGLSDEMRTETGHHIIVPYNHERGTWRMWVTREPDPTIGRTGEGPSRFRNPRVILADLGDDPDAVGARARKWLGHGEVMRAMREQMAPPRDDDPSWPRRFG